MTVYDGLDEPVGAFSWPKMVIRLNKRTDLACKLCSQFGGYFLVFGSPNDAILEDSVLVKAFTLLEDAHLDWLPVLSIGAIEFSSYDKKPADYIVRVSLDQTPHQVACTLIAQAAENLARIWLNVEAEHLATSESNRNVAQTFAAQLLSFLMLEEFEHRCNRNTLKLFELESPEVALADYPLTRHLVTFWNRRWNRQAFLRGSVFDYAPTLSALYKGETK